ncbi:hypothetical protein Maq22A_c28585 [Methylobacterium aquaticum]|uniref:Uncharacterized protein n=1 Tax=Methylobacterium aquaticum TaxID=270351 RepID=A0A1Y0ZFT6_9HYPH|nr:hypothetical protein Maq22A_c28585 [Methylobacterium aquaticum]
MLGLEGAGKPGADAGENGRKTPPLPQAGAEGKRGGGRLRNPATSCRRIRAPYSAGRGATRLSAAPVSR